MEIENIINSLNFSHIAWEIILPLIFMASDFITGFIQAVINKNVDSQKMREGILRKMLLIIILSLSFIVQYAFNINFLSKAVSIYLVIMEVISILENLKKAGIDLSALGNILKVKGE